MSSEIMVWSIYGSEVYHSVPDCSALKGSEWVPRVISANAAKRLWLRPCKRCWKEEAA